MPHASDQPWKWGGPGGVGSSAWCIGRRSEPQESQKRESGTKTVPHCEHDISMLASAICWGRTIGKNGKRGILPARACANRLWPSSSFSTKASSTSLTASSIAMFRSGQYHHIAKRLTQMKMEAQSCIQYSMNLMKNVHPQAVLNSSRLFICMASRHFAASSKCDKLLARKTSLLVGTCQSSVQHKPSSSSEMRSKLQNCQITVETVQPTMQALRIFLSGVRISGTLVKYRV
mmetsp:Transcript_106046/g.204087  ORF Transcript_106046/g.204087 Transcript_106046/m.204087 type:complete len:232 (+) Transcript_106046:68-763(+)